MERSNCSSTHLLSKGEIIAIVIVGIDLAKNVFAVNDVDEAGKPALVRPEVPKLGAYQDQEFAGLGREPEVGNSTRMQQQ
jgi:hypothetical protein